MRRVSNQNIILMVVAAALLMQNLDSTVIATALPQMAITFRTSPIHLSIGITAYLMSLAIFIPVSGWFADRFGSRTVFGAAIAVFTLGSILCGLSNGVVEFVASRVFQGIGGAMMVPVGRLIVFRAVGKSGLVRALSYLTMTAMIGPVMGPPVGGFITTYASWRWIFFLNVPIGLAGTTFVWIFFDNHREENTFSFDWIGFVSTGIAISSLVLDCDLVIQPDVSSVLTLSLFGVSIASGSFAAWYMLRCAQPVVDLGLLRIASFRTGVAVGTLYRVGTASIGYLMPILLQVNMGFSAFASGSVTFAAALGSLAIKMAIPPILRRWGFRTVLFGNGLISAGAIVACAFVTLVTPAYIIFTILLVGGFFRSLQFTSLTTLSYADIPDQRTSAATSFQSVMQQVSNGLGVAVSAILIHLVPFLRGETARMASVEDFHLVFGFMALVAVSACYFYARLPSDIGAEVSGHGRAPAPAEVAAD